MIEVTAETLAGKRIESRADAALSETPSSMREWVAQDVADFKIITDPDLARFAAVTITENLDTLGYKAEFETLGTEISKQVHALNEKNANLSWERDERDTMGYAFDLLEQEQQAKQWSKEEAQGQASKDINDYLNFNTSSSVTRAYEQEMRVADMARNAMVSPEYRMALESTNPEIAKQVAEHSVHPAAELMNATFVGKIVAISGVHIEQKVGRNPSDTIAHPRQGLSGDPVEVGQVATIKYAQGRGQIQNHEIAREQKGVGR